MLIITPSSALKPSDSVFNICLVFVIQQLCIQHNIKNTLYSVAKFQLTPKRFRIEGNLFWGGVQEQHNGIIPSTGSLPQRVLACDTFTNWSAPRDQYASTTQGLPMARPRPCAPLEMLQRGPHLRLSAYLTPQKVASQAVRAIGFLLSVKNCAALSVSVKNVNSLVISTSSFYFFIYNYLVYTINVLMMLLCFAVTRRRRGYT